MLALAAGPLRAQRVLGSGQAPDAFLVPRGTARISLSQSFDGFAERYDADGKRQPLAAAYNAQSFGAANLPALRAADQDVRTLSGLSLSLGTLNTRADALVRTARFDLDVGLASWLTIGATVPYVLTRVDVAALLNESGLGANAAVNPVRSGLSQTTQKAAVDSNRALAAQLDTAAARLQRQLTGCTPASACDAIQALLGEAAGYRAALERTFGTAPGSGAAFVPANNSAVQQAIDQRLSDFSGRVRTQLMENSDLIVSRPFAPEIPVTTSDLDLLATTDLAGVVGGEIGAIEHGHLGDVELRARVRLLDTFGGNADRRLSPRGFNLRAAVTGTFRLGTGRPDSPDEFFDVGAGDGQDDVEVGATADALFGSRAWVSVTARYTVQMADRLPRRITDSPADAFPEAFRLQTVDRDLGDAMQLEVAPRYALSEYFAVEGYYSFRRTEADTYAGVFDLTSEQTGGDPLTLDAATLGVGTGQREHRVGWSLVFSTLRGAHGRRPRLPIEIAFSHADVVRGSGFVARTSTSRIQMRAYTGLLGGRPTP